MGLIYPVLRGLKVDFKQKLVLFILFSLGTISILCNVIKSVVFLENPFVHGFIWATTEITVAIICASIPTLRPLFFKKAWVWHNRDAAEGSRLTATLHRRSDLPPAWERPQDLDYKPGGVGGLTSSSLTNATTIESEHSMELDKMDLDKIESDEMSEENISSNTNFEN